MMMMVMVNMKGPERSRRRLATSTMMRRREEYCARIIQTAWRQCVLDGRERRRSQADDDYVKTNGLYKLCLGYGGRTEGSDAGRLVVL